MEIEREGETLFVLNDDGINLWTAFIQGGRRADGSRVTTSDAAKIAANIQSMPKRIAELEVQLEAAKRDAIFEAVETCRKYSIPSRGAGGAVDRSQEACLVMDLINYANSLLEAQLKTAHEKLLEGWHKARREKLRNIKGE